MQTIEILNLDDNQVSTLKPDHSQLAPLEQARRQLEICNACRYCETYCSVFPAVHRERAFDDSDVKQLANLCHNCRGCYYACQYTAPHEFDLNLPQALAKVRQESWQDNAYPAVFAKAFHKSGAAIGAAVIVGFAALLWLIQLIGSSTANSPQANFYDMLSHNLMVAIFMPAFLLPLVSITLSVRRYWRDIGAEPLRFTHIKSAFASAAKMKNLAAGHGEGCHYEDEDRFSQARRYFHQATMYGFLLCFAATSCATLMHYLFDLVAPYDLNSLPKILGVSGGILLSSGTVGLAYLKSKADKNLGDTKVWGGEMAFILLLFIVSTSGLLLFGFANSPWLSELLAFHLGSVLAFFLLMPFSKMTHGFYRLASLIRDEQGKVEK